MKIIDIKGLTNLYNRKEMLQQVDLEVKKGDFVAIIGADDSGKTTLLHIIMGFIRKYQGNVQVLGKQPDNWNREDRSRIRYVPDNILWERNMSVDEYLKMAKTNSSYYNEELQNELCEEWEIPLQDELLNLTYQENKFVQIIAAVCAQPELLILDEPMNFLGTQGYRQLLDKLKQWNEAGMTILVAAERYEHVRGYCTSYAFLREGILEPLQKVPEVDKRWKVITVFGEVADSFRRAMDQCIREDYGRTVFLYTEDMDKLPELLKRLRPMDFIVEEMTLEEEVEEDYSRWE